MAATQFFYDRVEIYVDGVQYLPNGQIRNFRMTGVYTSTQQMGFTPTGASAGSIVGGSKVDPVSWGEYLPTAAEYQNWRTFLIANPNVTVVVIPISLATGVQVAPSFSITGLNCTSQEVTAPGESEACGRICTFNAQLSSNM
jgi:hypothetical protein